MIEVERARATYAAKMAALGELTSGISHEINNPLAAISGRLQILKRHQSALAPEQQEKYMTDLEKLETAVARIVKGLKTYARDGSKDPFEKTSLKQLLNESAELILPRAKELGIEIEFPHVDLEFECRPVEISQVIVNLLGNAIDAIEKNDSRWIEVSVEDHGGPDFILKVIDSGNGIPPEIVEKLMNPFFTTKPVGKGTGLGLSISKGLIEQHRGDLQVDASNPHTCFSIRLPKRHSDLPAEEKSNPPKAA